MKNIFIAARNALLGGLYKIIAKPMLFRFDPENVHERMLSLGRILGKRQWSRSFISSCFNFRHPVLRQNILGLSFANPVGLAAGFDKNAQLLEILPSVGFSFVEAGSFTGEPCVGNPKPRLWRLPRSKSLVVYYGLKNDGCEAIAQRLNSEQFDCIVGTSIAKTNTAATADDKTAIEDYAKGFSAFAEIGDYFTVNISCPNAFGGLPFTDPKRLDALLGRLDEIKTSKPIFLKLPPDLEPSEVDALLDIVKTHRVQGIVCANLTKNIKGIHPAEKYPGKGGLSGKLVETKADKLISYIYRKTSGRYVIMGVGGIFSAQDAYRKIRLGANLVQLITGMIFEGPQLISEINRGLVRLLQRDGYKNISEAVGADNK